MTPSVADRRSVSLIPLEGAKHYVMVIVQHVPVSVKQYHELGYRLAVPGRCPHPECGAVNALIRWGTYQRWVCTGGEQYRIRIQRIRCKVCLHTHSLLPDFAHPHRQYEVTLLHLVLSLYLIGGLSLRRLLRQLPGLARSTVRQWVDAFTHGAGQLLLDALTRRVAALNPLVEWPD